MSSFPEFYKEARAQDIVPIIGQETYIIDDVRTPIAKRPHNDNEWDKNSPENKTSFHMLLLAVNLEGYKTLAKLASIGYQDDGHFYRSSRIDFRDLEAMGSELDNIIATTGCLGGHVPNALEFGMPKRAAKYLKKYRSLFKNLYVELMLHPNIRDKTQEKINDELVHLAARYDVPLLITNDTHYVDAKQQDVHRMLIQSSERGVNKGSDFDVFSGTGYHIKSEKAMRQLGWSDKVWDENQNSQKNIWNKVKNFEMPLMEKKQFSWYIPEFQRKNKDENSHDYIMRLCLKKLKEFGLNTKKYRRRLKYEMEVISRAKFEEEFLIVRDYIRFADRNGILVGAGRGSMAGVLVAYLLGITGVDPIKYDLLFERALNPARPSLPDFDVDFQASRRQEVITYLEEKYGKENVQQVCTFGTMAPKGAIRAICRVYEVPYQQMVDACRGLPETSDITGARSSGELEDLLSDEEFLKRESPELITLMETYPDLKPMAVGIQGTIQNVGTHAAGVVISDSGRPIKEYVPTRLAKGKALTVTQYDMGGLKGFGFVKFDILGLNTLDTIAECIDGIGFDPFEGMKELEDQETWDMMNKGLLATIFQMQGHACRQCVQVMNIKSFEDIIAINALSRPGAMKFLDAYHKQRDNPKIVEYIHPKLESILGKSNGVLLYQEQTMQIGLDIAGFDHIIIDDLKEAIKYKKSKIFDMLHPKFLQGCIDNDCTKEQATQLWEMISDAKGYQFNRAHSVSYAILGFQTAYLKCHFPAHWFAAYLRTTDTKSPESKGRVEEILYEARRMGVKFRGPDINRSDISYKVTGENIIRIGLTSIKGVGQAAAAEMVSKRGKRYHSIDDLVARVERRKAGKRALDSLGHSGTLESIGVSGDADEVTRQLEYLGFALEIKASDEASAKINKLFDKYGDDFHEPIEADVIVKGGGRITRVDVHRTKVKPNGDGGKPYARIRIDWPPYAVELTAWQEQYEHYVKDLVRGKVCRFIGKRQAHWNSIILLKLEVLE